MTFLNSCTCIKTACQCGAWRMHQRGTIATIYVTQRSTAYLHFLVQSHNHGAVADGTSLRSAYSLGMSCS
jgi:hypothetical protein